MTFLGKSFGDYNEVEKSTVVPMSYEKLEDKEVETVLGNNKNLES